LARTGPLVEKQGLCLGPAAVWTGKAAGKSAVCHRNRKALSPEGDGLKDGSTIAAGRRQGHGGAATR
jgi:hypothetical protein